MKTVFATKAVVVEVVVVVVVVVLLNMSWCTICLCFVCYLLSSLLGKAQQLNLRYAYIFCSDQLRRQVFENIRRPL